MPNEKEYILSVGNAGAQRLAKLNKMLAPTTSQFFKEIDLKKGQKVLEIGCGTGNVTAMIAERVGQSGHVTALDLNEEQIAIAKEQMIEKKITNVSFYMQSVLYALPFSQEFDVVYSRLAIMHTSNFQQSLENMYAVLKPGGTLACEEASNAHYIHYPYNLAYDRSRTLLLELSKIKGMDPYIGDKLFTIFSQLNMADIHIKFVQPIYQSCEEKSIIPQFFDEIKANYIKSGLISEKEANELAWGIKEYVTDKNCLITFPVIAQIWGKKLALSY